MYAVYDNGKYIGTCQELYSFKRYCYCLSPHSQWDITAINVKNGVKRVYVYRQGGRFSKFYCSRASAEAFEQAKKDVATIPE